MSIRTIISKLGKDNIGVLGSIAAWNVLTSLVPILVGPTYPLTPQLALQGRPATRVLLHTA